MNLYAWFTAVGFGVSFFSYWLFNYSKKLSGLKLSWIFWLYAIYAFLLPGEVQDVALFQSVGHYLRQGIDFYWIDSSHGTYPFPPLMMPIYVVANIISQSILRLSFSFLLKLVLLPTAYFVARKLPKSTDQISFFLSPPLFAAVVYHGQIDIILIAFLVLALSNKKAIASGIFYGLSTLTKTWSIIFWPLWLRLKPKTFFIHSVAATAAIFAAIFIYTRTVGSSFTTVLRAIASHPGSSLGNWGLSVILKPFTAFLSRYQSIYIVSILLITHMVLWIKKVPIVKSIKIILLVFSATTLGFGLQYALWLVPFAYLDRDSVNVRRYSLLVTPFLALSYLNSAIHSNLNEVAHWLSLLPWAYLVYWLAGIIKPRVPVAQPG